jgi:beta-lactamase regulating signal transducer with metallopeptidase domain
METLLGIGLANAIMASGLALLAAIVGFFCRRPAVRHTLWLLVLLKLITPPVWSITVNYRAILKTVLPEGTPAFFQTCAVQTGSRQDAAADRAEQINGGPGGYQSAAWLADIPAIADESTGEVSKSEPAGSLVSELAVRALLPFLAVVWLAGSVLWFAVAGARIGRFQYLLRYGKPAPPVLQDQTRLVAERLGLKQCPTVWLIPGRLSPLLWALGREARLVVPAELLARLNPEQCAGLLAHELAHALRRDHWVRWLEFVVSGLYWWLPVAWWARRQLQQAEEECCDAWVVWTLPAAAKAYAQALLQTVDFLDARPALPPVASGIGHVRLLKRRLSMIVRQPLCPQVPWPVHLGIVAIGLLVLPLAPERLVAQDPEAKPGPKIAADITLVRAEQDPSDRDVERRLRALEERMDRLMQKLESQRREQSEKRSSEDSAAEEKARAREKARMAADKARAAAAEQRAKAKQLAEAAKEKLKAERAKDLTRKGEDGKAMNAEQVQRLQEQIQRLQADIHNKVGQALDSKRMDELKKRIQETVDENINPQRMREIQRQIEGVLKKSEQQLNEAMKKSMQELEKAQNRLREAERAVSKEPRSEKAGGPGQRDLERRMDRLEQKMDRLLQSLEKSGTGSRKTS